MCAKFIAMSRNGYFGKYTKSYKCFKLAKYTKAFVLTLLSLTNVKFLYNILNIKFAN